MPIRQKIFAIIVAVILLLAMIELVRRRKLREEYSWLWLLTGATILLVVVWYDLLVWLTGLIGAALPTTTLFLLAIIFLLSFALHFSVKVSKLENRVKELAQRQALGGERRSGTPAPEAPGAHSEEAVATDDETR